MSKGEYKSKQDGTFQLTLIARRKNSAFLSPCFSTHVLKTSITVVGATAANPVCPTEIGMEASGSVTQNLPDVFFAVDEPPNPNILSY